MSHRAASPIETTITALSDMEKELEQIRVRVEEMKRELLAVAREEAEKALDQAVAAAQTKAQEAIDVARLDAETEGKQILAETEQSIKALKNKIDQAFNRAVDVVVKTVLGE